MEHLLNAFLFIANVALVKTGPLGVEGICVRNGRSKYVHSFIPPCTSSPLSRGLSQNRNKYTHGNPGSESPGRSFRLQGVPRLYGWMMENYSKMRIPLEESEICELHIDESADGGVDFFYVDMNALIHSATHGNMTPAVMIEDQQRMRRIVTALLKIFKTVNPKKMMYIGVDGVCPSAKINQQRTRRFRLYKSSSGSTLSKYYESEDGKLGYTVKKLQVASYDNVTFNPNYISPGTEFMSMMDSELRNWIALQTYEGTWKDCYIVYSGTDVPGEGEHKIYDAIRRMTELDRNASLATHLVYGLDADLMMLSLITKLPKMYILREKHSHTPHILSKIKPDPYFSKETGLLHFHGMDYIDLKKDDFEVLSMRFLRNIMYSRCIKTSEPTANGQNKFLLGKGARHRLADDFALLSFLAGNDFLPHLPTVELCNDGFNDLMKTYYKLLPMFGGFLTEKHKINMSRLQLLMKELSKLEFRYFKQKSVVEGISQFNDPREYAKHYYENKCDIDFNNKKAIRKMCEQYIEGLFWTLSYYHSGCPSWNWCYKYHYAPLVSDLAKISTATIKFHKGEPITPLEHLLAITPPNNNQLLPPRYRNLSEPQGKLGQYFPEEFEISEEGKENEWEHVVKLPFLDTNHLKQVARSVNDELKYTNLYKNKPGYTNVYHRRGEDSSVEGTQK